MEEKLWRVGTTYIPVTNVERSAEWYVKKLGAELNFQNKDKAIVNIADQSIFLVRAAENQSSNFIDIHGYEHFALTFEVNGIDALVKIHDDFTQKDIIVGEIEDRGHTGRNFIFEDLDGNKFDVWSELSPAFKEKHFLRK